MSSVDVVVPCYNYARFLKRSVDSVLSQKGVDVRVLIIDDASSDSSAQLGHQLAAHDSRVEFRRHEVNKGHIATYNEGLLHWAGADYSLLLSADDALAPGALSRATQLMDCYGHVGMTYGMALIIDDEGDLAVSGREDSDEQLVLSGSDFLQRCCAFGNPVPTPTAVVRTKLQHQLGGYRADLPHTGDLEMWMRFAMHSRIGVVRAIQGYYRWHVGNMSSHYYADLVSDQRERMRACREVVDRWGAAYPQSASWVRDMSTRVGQEAFWLASKAFDKGDTQGTLACLQFANEHYSDLRWSRIWWRFQIKSLLGRRLWRLLSPAFRFLRTPRRTQSKPIKSDDRFQKGDVTGWWPGAE